MKFDKRNIFIGIFIMVLGIGAVFGNSYISDNEARLTNLSVNGDDTNLYAYYDCVVAIDGTGDYTHVQDCIDNVGGRIAIKEGNYTLDPRIRITTDNIHIIGIGKVMFYQPDSILYGIYSYSADTNVVDMPTNASENDMNITVSDASGFTIGDLIRIYDNLPGELHGTANISRGESTLIWNISGNILYLVDPLRNNYNTLYGANVSIIPTFKNIRISNIHINGSNYYNSQYGINLRNVQDSEIDHVTVSNTGGCGIGTFFDSYNIKIHDNFIYDVLRPGLGYGIYGGGNAARHIYVYDNTMQNVDEGIDCGGAGGAHGWPTDLHWYNNHIYGIASIGIDQHPVCTDVFLTGNTISGATTLTASGISLDGENAYAVGNFIYNMPKAGITVNSDQPKGDRMSSGRYITNNHVYNTGFENSYAIGGTTSGGIDNVHITNNIIQKHGVVGGSYAAIALGSFKNGSIINNVVIDGLTHGYDVHSSNTNVTEGINYFYNVAGTKSEGRFYFSRSMELSQPLYIKKTGLYITSPTGSALLSLQAEADSQDPIVLFKNETGDYRWWVYTDTSNADIFRIKSDDFGDIMNMNHEGKTAFGWYSTNNDGLVNIDNATSTHLKLRMHTEKSGVGDHVGIGFGVDTTNKYMKSSIAHIRTEGNGKGELLFLVDATTNAADVAITDVRAKVTSVGFEVFGETNITGIASDGVGKVVCIKINGNLGTCNDAPGAGGNCTCV